MASKKNLKKDISFLTSEVIETCMLKMYFDQNSNKEKHFKIIDDFLDFRNDTIEKVNNPEKVEGKGKLKTYYREIFEGFVNKVNEVFDSLSDEKKEEPAK